MLKIAVVGAGHIGRRHVNHFQSHPQAQVIAICDIDRVRADAIAKDFGLRVYTDVGEMLSVEEPDAVSVATSGPQSGGHHFEPVMLALHARKAVLVEKPISDDIFQARQMVQTARDLQVLFGVNLNHRFTPMAARLKEMHHSGTLGETLFLNMDLRINNATEKWPYHHLRALHPHSIDVMRYYGGDIKRVQCFLHKASTREVTWSNCAINVQFASGAVGHLTGSWDSSMSHGIERCEIGAAKGRAILHNIGERLEWMPRETSEKTVIENGIMNAMTFEDTFKIRLHRFVEQVLNNESLDASGEDGLAAQEVIEAAIRSHENGTVEEVRNMI